jgi:hypothetical protein
VYTFDEDEFKKSIGYLSDESPPPLTPIRNVRKPGYVVMFTGVSKPEGLREVGFIGREGGEVKHNHINTGSRGSRRRC